MSKRTTTTWGIALSALTVAAAVSVTTPPAAAAVPAGPASGAHAPLGRLGPLTELVVERLRVSDDVAAAKFGTGSPIDDPTREQAVLEEVRAQSAELGLGADSAVAFFGDQITASKVVQNGLFARWTAHPEEAPTTRPDLGEIRTRLDQLTTALLRELKATVHVRGAAVPCAVQLALATGSAVVVDELDGLHRRALGTAVRSVCNA